jgi:hypothetical protein
MGRREVCKGFCWEKVREVIYLEELSVDGSIILKRVFREWDVGA